MFELRKEGTIFDVSFPFRINFDIVRGKNLKVENLSRVCGIAHWKWLSFDRKYEGKPTNKRNTFVGRFSLVICPVSCTPRKSLEFLWYKTWVYFLSVFEKEGPVQTPNFSWEHEKFGVLPAYLTRKLWVLNGFNADIICLQILFAPP